jgi:endoglucanase
MRSFVLVSLFAVLIPAVAKAADSDVKVSSIGYLPARAKRASVTAAGTSFTVKRDADDSVAFAGNLGAASKDPDTGQSVAVADFTQLTEAGKFYVDVTGVGRSVSFPIGDDVYRDAFLAAMLGYYGWRCNTAVSFTFQGQIYSHDACHMDDAHLDYIGTSGGKRDGLKGWHDAGDYGKYVVNAGITVGSLLAAWEEYSTALATYAWAIPETGDATPDFLDEVRWELEWVLKMQYAAADGRVSHKLTSLTFDAPSDAGGSGIDRWVMPENDTQTRYFVPSSSAAIADFVAMLAKAARIYRSYDQDFADQCLAAAKVSYAYLQANTSNQTFTDPTSTGGYMTTDSDDRLWAAAEMWETTGDAAALSDFETRAAAFKTGTSNYVDADFDWGNVKNLGMYIYLQSKRSGRSQSLASAIQQSLLAAADSLVTAHNNSGYGRALSGKTGLYYWGSNGSVVRTCMLLQVANRLSPRADYLDTCVDQIGWIFGRNYYNRSQVTGIGIDPPMNPHHRPSKADGTTNPWPGLLVGGGNSTSTQAAGNKNGATNWIDDVNDYELNEVAINWNAPLVYALASFLDAYAGPPPSADAAVSPDAVAPSDAAPDSRPGDDVTAGPDVQPPADKASSNDAPAAGSDTAATGPDATVPASDGPGQPDQRSAVVSDAGPDASTTADAAGAADVTGKSDAAADAAGRSDAGADSPGVPLGNASRGCGCRIGRLQPGAGALWVLALLGALLLSCRRGRRSAPGPSVGASYGLSGNSVRPQRRPAGCGS